MHVNLNTRRCHIDKINSPDDGHMSVRNTQRIETNMHEKELCVKLVIYKDYHEYWVFQPAAQSPFRLSYTDSKQFSLEIKNCETRNNFLCSLIAYSLLSSRQYISILSSKLRKAANFGHTQTHTHRHYTLLCSLLFRLSETKKDIQSSEQISFVFKLSSK
jgi:hypothetical protein